jgi:hypothetical protein
MRAAASVCSASAAWEFLLASACLLNEAPMLKLLSKKCKEGNNTKELAVGTTPSSGKSVFACKKSCCSHLACAHSAMHHSNAWLLFRITHALQTAQEAQRSEQEKSRPGFPEKFHCGEALKRLILFEYCSTVPQCHSASTAPPGTGYTVYVYLIQIISVTFMRADT